MPRSRSEISRSDVRDLVGYVRALPASVPGPNDDDSLFVRVQCSSCHVPITGLAHASSGAVEVEAYTDFLVHEMGSGRRHDDKDSRTEFRTPPLWGVAATGPPYLHDGSAATLEEAILKHRGEAERSRLLFASLRPGEKQQLLNFVRTR